MRISRKSLRASTVCPRPHSNYSQDLINYPRLDFEDRPFEPRPFGLLVLACGDPRRGAAAYRDVADALASVRHRARILAPAAMEEPSPRVAVAVVGEPHRRVHHVA